MRAKIIISISPTGEYKINTVQGVGSSCRAVADLLAPVLGTADESTRADTEDLYVSNDPTLTVEH